MDNLLLDKETKKKIVKKVNRISTVFMVLTLVMLPAFAFNSNTQALDSFITFICDWAKKIGLLIAFIGGITFGVGWADNQQELKSRALMIIVGGFMIVAVGSSPEIFGL